MKSVFIKNVLTLITGNAFALVIPILLYPLVSRIFTPEDYALFGLYIGVFSFLEIASAGRYDFAIVIPKKNEDAINVIGCGFLISILYATVVLLLVILFKDVLAKQLNNPALANWLFFLPVSLLLVSISKLCNGWLFRMKNFKAASINKASQKLTEVAGQLSFAFISGNGLILGDLTGRLFNAVFSTYQSVRSGLERGMVNKRSMLINFKRYSEFPKFSILPSMLNTLGGMMPMFIISAYYSVDISGSFNFSRLLLSVPFALISTAISQVVMQQVSERRHNKETIAPEIFSLAWKLFLFSLLIIIPLYFAGPELFEFVFGDKWKVSGEYTSILIFSYAVTFIVSPLSILLVVLEKIKWGSFWQVFYFGAISALWLFNKILIKEFLFALVCIDLIAYGIYGFLIYRAVKRYEDNLESQLV